MENDKILQIAIKEFPNMLRNQKSSVFGFLNSCISTIAESEKEDKKRKQMLIEFLKNLWGIQGKYLVGCKKEDIQKAAEAIFGSGIQKAGILKPSIKNFKFEELQLYYCYMERIAKTQGSFQEMILRDQEQRKRKRQEADRERKKIEEEQKKMEQENKVSAMNRREFLWHEISNGKDVAYYQQLDCAGEEKILIAELLRDFWIQQEKWDGDKVSKKQTAKINKIKEILLHEGSEAGKVNYDTE